MVWSVLWFGRYAGRTLPQVMFLDPDWFYHATENGFFKGGERSKLLDEARTIDEKSRRIRIPGSETEDLLAEYFFHRHTGKLSHFAIVRRDKPIHEGASTTFRIDRIDLSIPRQHAPYDKGGNARHIATVKYYLFGSRNHRMTRKRSEEFFEDESNFVPN